MSSGSTLGRRYAKALLELAVEADKLPQIRENLEAFAAAWGESRELRNAFESPSLGAEARRGLVKALGDRLGFHPFALHVFYLLSDRRRMRFVPDVIEAYRDLAEEREGRVRAEVITAAPMPDAYFEELSNTLEAVTGRSVVLVKREDPSLIGGVVARVGDKVFDGSVRAHLAELKDELLQQ